MALDRTKGTPLLSVCVQTFQHVSYIRACLDSILMQKTDFDVEVIVGEDESTDGTREICIEYAERYPHSIRLFLRSRAEVIYIQGSATGRFNLVENLKAAQGKYIALCEGDDYWTDPFKLQKQVDFLEANSKYAICFHKVRVFDEKLQQFEDDHLRVPADSTDIYQLAEKGNYLHTASVVFRNQFLEFPEHFYRSPLGDLFLHMLNAKYGEIYRINESMGVYRKNSGTFSSKAILKQNMASALTRKLLSEYFSSIDMKVAKILKKKYTDILDIVLGRVANSEEDIELVLKYLYEKDKNPFFNLYQDVLTVKKSKEAKADVLLEKSKAIDLINALIEKLRVSVFAKLPKFLIIKRWSNLIGHSK